MEGIVEYALLTGVGLIAGFVNVIAGGGSFLTLPTLIFTGLPATLANGTNRVGLIFQNFFAVLRFKKLKVFPLKFAILVTVPAVFGSILGAYWALQVSDVLFKNILAFFMVAITLISLYLKPTERLKKKSHVENDNIPTKKWALIIISFFLIGIYGGFVQAGVGFLILSALSLSGYDLIRSNAIKVFVVLIFTIIAFSMFLMKGQVNFSKGLALAAGMIVGGQLGAVIQVKKGNKFIRNFVTVAIILFAIKLLIGK